MLRGQQQLTKIQVLVMDPNTEQPTTTTTSSKIVVVVNDDDDVDIHHKKRQYNEMDTITNTVTTTTTTTTVTDVNTSDHKGNKRPCFTKPDENRNTTTNNVNEKDLNQDHDNNHENDSDLENDHDDSDNDNDIDIDDPTLPKNRFELELEFLQSLASPAYLHFLATTRVSDVMITINEENDHNDNNNKKDESTTTTTTTSKEQQQQQQQSSSSKTTTTTTKEDDTKTSSLSGKDGSGTTSSNNNNITTSTTSLLLDPTLHEFLRYLQRTWTRPEYSKYVCYPHCYYFLNLILTNPNVISKEFTLPTYRNFCHQQQFYSWQNRHATLYGIGGNSNNTNSGVQEVDPLSQSTTTKGEEVIIGNEKQG